jgi:hypothetical protein
MSTPAAAPWVRAAEAPVENDRPLRMDSPSTPSGAPHESKRGCGDEAAIFRVNAKSPKAGDGFTQFGRAMHDAATESAHSGRCLDRRAR